MIKRLHGSQIVVTGLQKGVGGIGAGCGRLRIVHKDFLRLGQQIEYGDAGIVHIIDAFAPGVDGRRTGISLA